MVYLAIDRTGALEAIDVARRSGCDVWMGSDAITAAEHQQLISEGLKVTRFSYPLGASYDRMQDAIETIQEHHHGRSIWVQYAQEP